MAPSPALLAMLKARAQNSGRKAVADVYSGYANALSAVYTHASGTSLATRFSNMRDSDYENIMARAHSSLQMGSNFGLMAATKFASDAFNYSTIPAMRMAGATAGKYGQTVTEYLQTKEQFKQEYKMMGMQAGVVGGAMLGQFVSNFVGGGLIRSGITTLGAAGVEALTGLGIVAAIPTAILGLIQIAAGYLAKLVVGAAITAASGYVGAKVGEKIGDKYGDKYSDITLGKNMVSMTGELVNTWAKSRSYLVSRGGSLAFKDILPIARKLDRGAGMNLDYFYQDDQDKLAYANNFTEGYAGKDVEGVAGYSMMLDNISGTDMGTSIKEYSKSNPEADVKTVSRAIETFLGASVGGGKLNRSTFEAAKYLMQFSSEYGARRLANRESITRTFAGLYNLMDKAQPGSSRSNTLRANNLLGGIDQLFDGITSHTLVGSRLGQSLNIGYKDIIGGAASNPETINRLLKGLSSEYGLGGLKLDKEGKLSMGKNDELAAQNAMMTFRKGNGGLELGYGQSHEIIRAIAAMQTYGEANFDANTFQKEGKEQVEGVKKDIKQDMVFKLFAEGALLTNKLLDASSKFLAQSTDFGVTVRNYYSKHGNLMAEFMIKRMTELTGMDFEAGGAFAPMNDTAGIDIYNAPDSPSLPPTGPQGRGSVDTSTKGWRDFVLARYSLSEANEIKAALEGVSSRLGIDPNELAALYSIESGWNSRADNGRYFGLNQMGVNELKMVGLTPASYKALSAAQQVEVTYKYMSALGLVGKVKTAGEIYAVTIAQAYFTLKARHGDNYVVYKEGSDAYRLNAAAWNTKNGDGGITIAEIGRALYSHSKTRMFSSTAGTFSTPGVVAGVSNTGDDKYGNSRGSNIAAVAQRFMRSGLINTNVGRDYWRRFCAAFVNKVLQASGDVNLFGGAYSTASSVRDKYRARGLLMSKSEAGGYQVGDVLFWNEDDANGGHVAIYVGNGMVIQAGNFSDHIEMRSVVGTFGRNENVSIYRPGRNEVRAISPVVDNVAPTPKPAGNEGKLASTLEEIAEGELGDKFSVSVKETSGGYKFVVKYNTGNGYKVVSDKTVLRTVENNIERGLTKKGIDMRSGGNTHYFFVEGSNVDINKLAGALR